MSKKILKDSVISENASIKEAMRFIDHSGQRVAYIVDARHELAGVVSDSEIRKAIIKGKDIKRPVKEILNADPIVLSYKEISSSLLVNRKIKKLLERMPDSQYILALDDNKRPLKLLHIPELISKRTVKNRILSEGKRILVVGGAGYLGSILVRKLLAEKFKVRVLDLLLYGIQPVEQLLGDNNFELMQGDMRDISTLIRSLADVDAVINLAAIVGDPACNNKPEDAIETNFLANKVLAEACKYNQINKFLYASTCSVYGTMAGSSKLTEESMLNPVSLYARSKIQSEEGILSLVDENFAPTVLRMSTLYGHSPRMRFDLVVNTMTKTAVIDRKILVHGGGKQWRPLLNVEDAAEAYVACLKAPINRIKGEIFNVGSSAQNYQIIQIGEAVKKCIPKAELVVEADSVDPRDYFVDFSKIERSLKYKANSKLEESIAEIKNAIEGGQVKNVDDQKYYNVETG